MKKILLFSALTILFFNCEKKDAQSDVHLLFTDGGQWYFEKILINGVDSTASWQDGVEININTMSYYFSEKGKYHTSDVVTVDFRFEYRINRNRSLEFYNRAYIEPCTFVKKGIKDPFILHTAPCTWKIEKLTERELTMTMVSNNTNYALQFNKVLPNQH